MAKTESTFTNMLVTLLLVTLIASTSLGYIYELTKEPIAAAKLAKKLAAINMVISDYDNNPVDDMYKIPVADGSDSLEVYPATKGGLATGAAVRTFSKNGYSGLVWLMVGIKPDGTISNIAIVDHKETPGLGTKMADPKFKDQFINLNPASFNIKVKKDGGDVDAITAATISSRAFCEATRLALETYEKGEKK